jgi:N-glycosylase/DNA lyase
MGLDAIRMRLAEFETYFNSPVSWHYENDQMILKNSDRDDNKRLFEEMTFCLLTANTSAVMGMKTVDALRDILFTASLDELRERLKECRYRFPNKRSEYIYLAREKFAYNLKDLITTKDKYGLRDYLVENIKGFGYKEASHFLRNVGVKGLAILDKHILRSMNEKRLIDSVPKSLNKKRYLEHESKLIEYSQKTGIDMDELDLVFWSGKTGRILK